MSLAKRRADGAGLIEWMHAGEDFEAATALLSIARHQLAPRKLYAFTASATKAAVPGLPSKLRSATTHALIAAGFKPSSTQNYMLCDLDDLSAKINDHVAEVTYLDDFQGWRLAVKNSEGRVLANALLSHPDADSGTATLWSLFVHPAYRCQGIGHRLLSQCLSIAGMTGAQRVAAYVDPSDQSFTHFLSAHEFDVIDYLSVYHHAS
ncbi:GNAT family N-acetyltransferase [Streptomyces sp900105245]|uniref:GNAT family N-acetyltransferase n=1 Tax=Streptomyces sp. 900105245 TaxID=3154379 RepID=A0ABV1UM77_9ACTN